MAKGTAVLRARNEKRVLAHLRQHRTSSRQEMADTLGLGKNTVSLIVDGLLKQGVVVEAGSDASGVGRPRIEVALVSAAMQTIGVQIRDTHLDIVVTDYAGEVLATRQVAVDARQTDDCLCSVADHCNALLETHSRVLGIGVAVPGMVDPLHGHVHASTHLGWTDVPLAARLQARLPATRLLVLNRVKAAALSPLRVVPDSADSTFYVRIDEGVGGALVVGTDILQGKSWTAGEIGHLCVDPDGPLCECGQRGCLERLIGVPAILAQMHEQWPGAFPHVPPANLRPGTDRAAAWESTMRSVGVWLGRALAVVVNLLNPECIVVDSPYGDHAAFRGSLLSTVRDAALAHPFAHTTFVFATMPHASALGVARAVILDFEQSE